jgi:hypothetical protein
MPGPLASTPSATPNDKLDIAPADRPNNAPERGEQLAGKGNNHLGLVRPFDTLGPAPEPLGQSAVLLE